MQRDRPSLLDAQPPTTPAAAHADGIAAAVATIRAEFPALSRLHAGQPYSYLDGPGGTQVPRRTIDAMARYLEQSNANHEGAFATSQESDAILAEAHAAAADFLGAAGPDEVVFGQNMTTLTFAVSRAIGRTLRAGDEVVMTRLDHDANVAPWLALEEERGIIVRWVGVRDGDCTLDLEEVDRAIGGGPRVQRRRHGQPCGTHRRDGPRRRGIDLRRCRPWGASHAYRRGRPGYGLPGLLHLQVLRTSSGTAVRKARASGEAGRLQGATCP